VSSKPRHRADKPDGDGKGTSRHDATAGRYLLASIPRASADQTVGAVIADLMSHKYDCLDIVCVLDAEKHLIGIMPLTSLFALPRETKMGGVVHDSFPKVHATTDQEHMASLALHHSLNAMPVIDANDRLLGIVPSVALLHILRREHEKDFHRFAGISWEENRAREAIESSALVRLRYRLPGYCSGFLVAYWQRSSWHGLKRLYL
jgi:magnesium transporter